MTTGKFLAFGEMLLRLSPPVAELLLQSNRLETHFGGAEINVAVALARLGHRTGVATAVPDDAIGDAALTFLRGNGVAVDSVSRAEGRLGLYFASAGAGHRAGEVVYDRRNSVFAGTPSEAWNWDALLADVAHLHLSGITPALSPSNARAALTAAQAARRRGVRLSFDVNYRPTLWRGREDEARTILAQLVDQASILFGNERDIGLLLGRDYTVDGEGRHEAIRDAFATWPHLRLMASTSRRVGSAGETVLSANVDTADAKGLANPVTLTNAIYRIGSGDAFAAGVLDALARNRPLDEVAQTGLALAVLKHSLPGDASLLGRRELDAYLSGVRDIRR